MKAKNRKKRLLARQQSWEDMRGDGGSDKKKKVGKSEFTKPGSLKK